MGDVKVEEQRGPMRALEWSTRDPGARRAIGPRANKWLALFRERGREEKVSRNEMPESRAARPTS